MSIDSIAVKANSLVDDDYYYQEYRRIKAEHGVKLVEEWTEKTDAKRYVFEDCGILAYVLAVKRELKLEFTYYADLACGNGLLVHLMTLEGFKGYGFDARTRGIWEKFMADGADLRKMSLDPSDVNCTGIPKETDFLIGNHSDELTPWIPVIAARRNCNFFLLPCCFFDFYHKFNNKPTNKYKGGVGKSRYDQYLEYVKSIGERLGFQMRVDKLKTSSNKRVCFIGTIPPEGLFANREQIIEKMLAESCSTSNTFKPIGDTHDPRNCTKIPFDYRQQLSKKLAMILIGSSEEKINGWQCGSKIHLSELSKHLTDEEKSHLKSQFGGLQTFLKNLSQAFFVRAGEVALRRWPELYQEFCKDPKKFKVAYCWFFNQHPQGCPIDEALCPYIHRPFAKNLQKTPKSNCLEEAQVEESESVAQSNG